MEREILFRGRQLHNERKWIYGTLMKYQAQKTKEIIYMIYNLNGIYECIVPETRGQYTGLTDKNGVKIFEGDILRHDSGTLHEVVFEQRNGHAYFGWVIDKQETWHFDNGFLRQLEVVGNIHDNPELLKE